MSKENEQKRRYCFTWNNYPTKSEPKAGPLDKFTKAMKAKAPNVPQDEDQPWKTALKKLKYSYIVVGFEIAPTTGTPHLQGYVEFKSGKRITTMAKACPGPKYIPCEGSAKENYDYCTKDGDFWEDGEISQQGKRMDLEAAMADIKEGMDELDFFEKHPMVMFRYPKSCDRYRTLCEKKRMKGYNKKHVKVFYGKTGTCKTKSAVEEFPEAFIVSSTQTGLWWDGYDGEECVILDEFRDSAVCLAQFLRILDGYYCQVPIKGGSKTLCAKNIIITSNTDPQTWYLGCDKESREAMFRRFDEIFYFKSSDDVVKVEATIAVPKKFSPMKENSKGGDPEFDCDATEVRGGNTEPHAIPEYQKKLKLVRSEPFVK